MARTDPRSRYHQHKGRAKDRGIPFELSFEQWWGLWEPHWDRRGVGAGSLVMCRTSDKGAYTVGNVRIATKKENSQESALERKCSNSHAAWSAGKKALNLVSRG